MPLPDVIEGARTYFDERYRPPNLDLIPGMGEPPPFNIDGTLDLLYPDATAEDRTGIATVLSNTVRSAPTSFRVAPEEWAAGVNQSLAYLWEQLDAMSSVVSDVTGWKKGNLWAEAAKEYRKNAQFWSDRAKATGATAVDELIGQIVGGLPVGIATWKFGRWPFAGMAGGALSYEAGRPNPAVEAIVSAMEWKVLDKLMALMEPFQWYLRIPTNMAAFGAAAMGEGAPSEDVIAQMVMGAAMAAYSPNTVGERYGLNRLRAELQNAYGDWKTAAEPYYLPIKGEEGRFWTKPTGEVVSPFYTTSETVINEKMPNIATGPAIKSILKSGGVSPDEMKWMGIDKFLDEHPGKISKQEMMDHLAANQLEIKETPLGPGPSDVPLATMPAYTEAWRKMQAGEITGEEFDAIRGKLIKTFPETKFGREGLVIPGGTNYREILFSLPKPGESEMGFMGVPLETAYQEPHWAAQGISEPNIFAHVRANDRIGSNGEKILFLEEIQSQWALEVRKGKEGVPPLPFSKNWYEYVGKRMIRYAAENGYDEIAWTTGEMQAERYDLSKQINSIAWNQREPGYYDVAYQTTKGQNEEFPGRYTAAQLPEIVGKDIADKIIKADIPIGELGELHGVDLKFGGEWAANLYDRMFPQFLNEYGKRWGAKTGESEIRTHIEEDMWHKQTVHSFPLTESMKKTVMQEGQPLFGKGARVSFLGETGAMIPGAPVGGEEPPKDGKGKQRKFLQTVADAERSTPELVKGVKEIEPQEYDPQTNKEWVDQAKMRIEASEEEALKWVLSEEPATGQKTTTALELIDKYQREGRYDAAVELIDKYEPQLREAGRGIQAVAMWSKITPPGFLRWAERQIELVNQNRTWLDAVFGRGEVALTKEDKTFILTRKNEINQIQDPIERTNATLNLIDYVARKVPPGISELIDDFRYSNMLSGPRTTMRNWGQALTNVYFTRPWEIGTRAGLDWIVAGLRGRERQYYLSDVPLYLKTTLNAIPNAAHVFAEVMKGERLATGGITTEAFGGQEYAQAFRLAREKLNPPVLTFVKRTMEAADAMNAAEISAGETAIELRKGKSPEEAYAAGEMMAKKYLYREQTHPSDEDLSLMSKLLSGVQLGAQYIRKTPVLKYPFGWAVPFITVPANYGIQMIEHSPLTALRMPNTWDIEVASRFINGSIITALGALAAYHGETTWAPPISDKEKTWFYGSKRMPFSWRIPGTDKWVSFWYLGPYALAFAIPTAVKWYFEDNPKAMTQDVYRKLINTAGGITRFLASQTSSQSLGNFFSAMAGDIEFNNPSRQLGYALGQAIPAHALLRWTNYWMDDIYRKPEGFFDYLIGDVPIPVKDEQGEWTTYSKMIAPRRGPLGEPQERQWWNQLIPYDVSSVENPLYDKMYPMLHTFRQFEAIPGEMGNLIRKLYLGEISQKEYEDRMKELNPESYRRLFEQGKERR